MTRSTTSARLKGGTAALTLGTPGHKRSSRPVGEFRHPHLRAVMDRMAHGAPTSVVFFGGSITWGATATDPLRTSWRALVERELRRRHPRTPLTAVDAAVGGQPSELGVFRMDRDVLPYEPDLVFIEFTVNDGNRPGAAESMEGIIRKLRMHLPHTAIVPVVFGYAGPRTYVSAARPAHLRVFAHYGLPVIDAVPPVQRQVQAGLKLTAFLTDGTHPNDQGYRLYADITIERLDALRARRGPPRPAPRKPLTANRYAAARMIELAALGAPPGWEAGVPSVVGTWFDHTPSRWHDSTVRPMVAGAKLQTQCAVSGAGLYFELIPNGKPLFLRVDNTAPAVIDTANTFDFARVSYVFKWLEAAGPHRLTLEAPAGGPAAAAYLLVAGECQSQRAHHAKRAIVPVTASLRAGRKRKPR